MPKKAKIDEASSSSDEENDSSQSSTGSRDDRPFDRVGKDGKLKLNVTIVWEAGFSFKPRDDTEEAILIVSGRNIYSRANIEEFRGEVEDALRSEGYTFDDIDLFLKRPGKSQVGLKTRCDTIFRENNHSMSKRFTYHIG